MITASGCPSARQRRKITIQSAPWLKTCLLFCAGFQVPEATNNDFLSGGGGRSENDDEQAVRRAENQREWDALETQQKLGRIEANQRAEEWARWNDQIEDLRDW